MSFRKPIRGGLAAFSLLLAACTSTPTTVTTLPGKEIKSLGQTEGRACGSILLLSTAFNVIPAGLNSRVETAYNRALQQKPGAKALVNVTVQEDWFWWVLGTARCVTVKGEAIE